MKIWKQKREGLKECWLQIYEERYAVELEGIESNERIQVSKQDIQKYYTLVEVSCDACSRKEKKMYETQRGVYCERCFLNLNEVYSIPNGRGTKYYREEQQIGVKKEEVLQKLVKEGRVHVYKLP